MTQKRIKLLVRFDAHYLQQDQLNIRDYLRIGSFKNKWLVAKL